MRDIHASHANQVKYMGLMTKKMHKARLLNKEDLELDPLSKQEIINNDIENSNYLAPSLEDTGDYTGNNERSIKYNINESLDNLSDKEKSSFKSDSSFNQSCEEE